MSNSTVARPVLKSAKSTRPVTSFDVNGQSGKAYPRHTVYCRPAPSQSKFAGQVFVEIHCNKRDFAAQPLTQNGIQYQEFEAVYSGLGGNFKILRCITTLEGLRKLEQLCSLTDDPSRLAVHREIVGNWSKYFGNRYRHNNAKF